MNIIETHFNYLGALNFCGGTFTLLMNGWPRSVDALGLELASLIIEQKRKVKNISEFKKDLERERERVKPPYKTILHERIGLTR